MRCRFFNHLLTGWWIFALLLYGPTASIASEGAPVESRAAPRPDLPRAMPIDTAPSIPHIALLLPTKSAAFTRAAHAVQQGFLSAGKVQGHAALPIRIYALGDAADDVTGNYRDAIAAGARLVVGPLTRGGVTTLASSGLVEVPTLALNTPSSDTVLPPLFYTFGLQVETEARQVARLMLRDGRRNVITVRGETHLLQRINVAFVDELLRGGGRVMAEFEFSTDQTDLARMKPATTDADAAFLALDVSRARLARPYLDPLPLYGTSQINPGPAGPLVGFDLAGIRFLDMPWLVQPDHSAVVIYPRADYHDQLDLERLYALGIDTFRVSQALLNGTAQSPIDGVTGRITLSPGRQFERELVIAQFVDGRLVTDEPARP